jgi:hypothetical protein
MDAPELLKSLEADLAAMPHPADVPNVPSQQEEWYKKHTSFTRKVSIVKNSTSEIMQLNEKIYLLDKVLTSLNGIRAELCDLLVQSSGKSFDLVQGTKVGILLLDGRFDRRDAIPTNSPLLAKLDALDLPHPHLWNPASKVYGPIPSIEARIAELTKRRAEAQAELDGIAPRNGS